METTTFDVIIIGAGAMGSAAAYHLAHEGKKVLLLEQFHIAHSRGSSHGESRIFRYAYDNPAYVRLAIQSKRLWQTLEQEAGEPLLRDIGGLYIGENAKGKAEVKKIADTLQATHSQWEELNSAMVEKRFPQWQLKDDIIAIYSPDTSVLNPTQCVQLLVKRAATYGAIIGEQEMVCQILPFAEHVEVITHKHHYRAEHLILTAGAWSKQLLASIGVYLPLQVSQEQLVYFRPRTKIADFTPETFPIWIHFHEEITYGFPILNTPGMKIGFHHDGLYLEIDDYQQAPREEVTLRLRTYLEQHLPTAAGEAFDATTCLYTNTPDQDFIVDRLPTFPHIAIAAGFSGHGFKFAIAIGYALAELIRQGHSEIEIQHLSIKRFLPS